MDAAYDDLGEPTFHCEHGTYVGSPYGPDYLCGPCEDGISAAELAEMRRAAADRSLQDANEQWGKLEANALATAPSMAKAWSIRSALVAWAFKWEAPRHSPEAVRRFLETT